MRRVSRVVLAAVLGGLFAGCGGGGNPSLTPAGQGTGRATFTIVWPTRARVIPDAANSILVGVSQGAVHIAQNLVVRPAAGGTSTATFDALPIGSLGVTATAYPNADGSGTAVATATIPLTVVSNQTTNFNLTLGSTIDHLELASPGPQVAVGGKLQLTVTAKDATGSVVLLSAQKLNWMSADTTVATVDSNGLVTGVKPGSVGVSVTDSESQKTASLTVTVGPAGSANSNLTLHRAAKIILKRGENSLYTAVIDQAGGYAYFATAGSVQPGFIIKVALGVGGAPPVEIGSIQLPAGLEGAVCSAIDPVHGYAYFGSVHAPGIILKVALGAGSALPRLVGSLTLNQGEDTLLGAAIDINNGYAYFGTGVAPAAVVKVSLGQGDAPPTRVGAANLDPNVGRVRRVLMDSTAGYVYALTGDNSSSTLVKLAPGNGASPPTQVGSVTLPAGEDHLNFAALDPGTGYAYLGTYEPGGLSDDTTPGKIVKVRLNTGDTAPTRVGSVTVPQKFFTSGGIDPNTHYIYIGNDTTFPASNVLQVAPGQGDALPSVVATIQLMPGTVNYTYATRPTIADATLAGEIYIQSGVIDSAAGYAYFGTDTRPGQIIKVAIPAN